MKIAFYDLTSVGLSRYPARVARELRSACPGISIYGYYDDLLGRSHAELECDFGPAAKIRHLNRVTSRQLARLLILDSPAALLVMAPRLPDMRAITTARRFGILTAQIQHGLYLPHMERTAGMWIRNARKAAWYAQCALEIGRDSSVGRFRALCGASLRFANGEMSRYSRLFLKATAPDVCYVYGPYWERFFVDRYAYADSAFVHTGYPDLEGIEVAPDCAPEFDVCYIAQSLVEDGRLQRDVMCRFLNGLSEAVENLGLRLAIKLHPRSDLSLFTAFDTSAALIRDQFPRAACYVGHYSSLLAAGFFAHGRVVLARLPGHKIPDYFSKYANAEVDGLDSRALLAGVQAALRSEIPNYPGDVFPVSEEGAANIIATDVLGRIRSAADRPDGESIARPSNGE